MSRSPSSRTIVTMAFSVVLVAASSCKYGPTAVKQPDISPSRAGDMAMEQYDADGDGAVAGDELKRAPGLAAALPRLDTNQDQAVSADEVADRVKSWKEMRTGLMSFSFIVKQNGKPLPGATVTFEPEPFLGDDIRPAITTTNSSGGGSATIPKELRPDPSYPPGMQLGLYKVKISKIVDGKETIPASYNEATVLGQECAPDVPEISNRGIVYEITGQ